MPKKSNKRTALSVASSRDRTPVKWEDISSFLPDTIQQTDATKTAVPVSNPWVQSALNGLANAAPSLHTAANSDKFLKIIGPPEALDGTLGRMLDKEGNILGGVVDKSGKLAGQTRFEDAAGALNAAAAAAAIFQVLSVVSAQYYLHEIATSLASIESKVDDINFKMNSQQLGEIQGAVDTIDEIYDANMRLIDATGHMDWQAPDKVEFWTRVANAETALRKNVIALEREIGNELKKISNKVRDGETRRKESFNEHRELLEELREFQSSALVQNYLLAIRGMMKWYQLTLSFDSQTFDGMRSGRYEQMVKFVKTHARFMNTLEEEYGFILDRTDGKSWKDYFITGGKAILKQQLEIRPWKKKTIWGRYKEVDMQRENGFSADIAKARSELKLNEDPLHITAFGLNQMVASFDMPQEFYIGTQIHEDSQKLSLLLNADDHH